MNNESLLMISFVLKIFARITTMNLKESRKWYTYSKCLSWKSNGITFIQLVWKEKNLWKHSNDWTNNNTEMTSAKECRMWNFSSVLICINHSYTRVCLSWMCKCEKLDIWNCKYEHSNTNLSVVACTNVNFNSIPTRMTET